MSRHLARRRLVVIATVLASLLLFTAPASAQQATPPYPTASLAAALQTTVLRLLLGQDTTAPGPGVDDWSCRPTARHPDPIVLLHAAAANGYDNWTYLGPNLASRGYCVFALTYGQSFPGSLFGGIAGVSQSVPEIGAFIRKVIAATGAAKVDLVGHSEGASLALYMPKAAEAPGLASKIGQVVALGPPAIDNTPNLLFINPLLSAAGLFGATALVQGIFASLNASWLMDAAPGAPYWTRLFGSPVVQPGVDYTVIVTQHDEAAATPPTDAFVHEPGVHNVLLQDVCPADPAGHVGLAFDGVVLGLIDHAFTPSSTTPITCTDYGIPI